MVDSPLASRARLAAVPAEVTRSEPLPPEVAPLPEEAPDLLAALDAGDEEAVRQWVRAHMPEPESLLVYGALAVLGVVGLMEWPAALIAGLSQLFIDRRFGGVEKVTAELRARVEGLSARA
jgi:hypothetical protein